MRRRKPAAAAEQRRSIIAMGFNPFRPQDKTMIDIVLVVAAAALTLAVVLWAVFG